jgi:hypothetical protein
METGTGVWIDSRTALIARVAADGEDSGEIRRITTDLEKQLRLSSGERGGTAYGPQSAPSDDMRETSSRRNLRVFFDEVVAAVRGSPRIFVFGPGEPKREFKKRLERDGLGGRVDEIETAGFLTDRQVAARARDHFRPRGPDRPRFDGVAGGIEMRMEKSRGGPRPMDGRPTPEQKSEMLKRLSIELPSGPAASAVAVDFPRSGEHVSSREYALRISTEAQGPVDVSIDGGAWKPCRQAAGYWWLDWSGYRAGPHSAFARVTLHRRRRLLSERRDFVVDHAE